MSESRKSSGARVTGTPAGPVAGETLKNSVRWPGYGLFALAVLGIALCLAGLAFGRTASAWVAAAVAAAAFVGGVAWLYFERRRLRRELISGTPERPEDGQAVSEP